MSIRTFGGLAAFFIALWIISSGARASEEVLYGVPTGTDWTSTGMYPSWKLLDEKGDQSKTSIRSYIRESHTRESYDELIEVVIYRGETTPDIRRWVQKSAYEGSKRCKKYALVKPQFGKINGYEVAVYGNQCTGLVKPETQSGEEVTVEFAMFKLIAGEQDSFLVMRSWRGPYASELYPPQNKIVMQDWMAFIRGVHVCNTSKSDQVCRP